MLCVLVRFAWIVVAATTIIRLLLAYRLPLSGDEAYYWEWSRRLAFGYIDHPPMVAWLIALATFAVKSALLVRLPFALCGLGASFALAAFANRSTGDARSGATAAILLSLAPFALIAFTMATPDGAELFFWCLSLYLAARVFQTAKPVLLFPLALSLAAAFLSSILAAFLILGVVAVFALRFHLLAKNSGASWTLSAACAALVFLAGISTYVVWDATHGWQALRFAILARHTTILGGNVLTLLAVFAAVLTPGVFIALFPAVGRLIRGRSPEEQLLFFTAAPLLAVCILLSFREHVEFNWADGALCSLIACLGLYAPRLFKPPVLRAILVQAVLVAAILFVVAALPMQSLRVVENVFGVHLRNQGAFEIWSFEPAAHAVSAEARADDAMVMTDGYGLSSVLDFYADIPPVVIGYDAQGREARRWLTQPISSNAIFFDKEPLATRPDFRAALAQACGNVIDDGSRTYTLEGQVTRTFYLTRCTGLTATRFAVLLFPGKPAP